MWWFSTRAGLALLLAGSALAWAGAAPSAARAQASERPAVDRAREEFRRGVTLAERHDWEGAEAAFSRAHALFPEPVILFNLAGARAQLGRLLEAREAYRRFLSQSNADGPSESRAAARRQIARLERRLGRLTIRIPGGDARPSDLVQLDGETQEVDDGDEVLVNPGPRVVSLRRGGAEIARARVEVPEGGRAVAVLELLSPERLGAAGASSSGEAAASDGDDALWVGLGVGGGVLLALGAAVAAGLALSSDPGHTGNVPPGVLTVDLTAPLP